jgi:hypothetical protein
MIRRACNDQDNELLHQRSNPGEAVSPHNCRLSVAESGF